MNLGNLSKPACGGTKGKVRRVHQFYGAKDGRLHFSDFSHGCPDNR